MSQNKPQNPHAPTSTSTKNPCNEFLVQHLLKLRQKQGNFNFKMMIGRSRSRHNDHQYHHYTRAMDSIRKYPLPIVCEEQLGLLAGIGDGLSGKLVGVIREHYKRFLKGDESVPEKKEEAKSKYNELKHSKSEKQLNWLSQGSSVNSVKSAQSQGQISQDPQQCDSQNRDKMHPFPHSNKCPSQHDIKSTKSQNLSKRSQAYKPRKGTLAANVIKVLKMLNAMENSMTKKDIQKGLLDNNYDKIKQWKNCKDNLLKTGYIQQDPSVDYQAFFLTAKGLDFAKENQQEQLSNVSKRKMQLQVNSFKQKFLQKQRQKQQASISLAISMHSAPQNSQSNSQNTSLLTRKKLEKKPQQNLIILIDTRQMKDQDQKSFFQETFVEKYRVDVMTQILTIGDFAFAYNGEILDYIIQRKKADDLSASIIDGRYREQKMRLKNCGASNIIYLYEGHPSQSSTLKQRQLMSALHSTRAAGFKVYKTARTTQTVKLISSLHAELQKRIENGQQLMTIGTIEQFNRRNTKNRYSTVSSVFALGLKVFPNVGRQTVSNLLRYFKSYFQLYNGLKKYQNNEERVEFLNGLLKGGRTQAGVTNLIVQCIFGEGNKKQNMVNSQQMIEQ